MKRKHWLAVFDLCVDLMRWAVIGSALVAAGLIAGVLTGVLG